MGQTVQNGPKWLTTDQNSPKRSKTAKNVPRRQGDRGDLKLFGRYTYRTNTFQKGASLNWRTSSCYLMVQVVNGDLDRRGLTRMKNDKTKQQCPLPSCTQTAAKPLNSRKILTDGNVWPKENRKINILNRQTCYCGVSVCDMRNNRWASKSHCLVEAGG